jgi:rubredoxin
MSQAQALSTSFGFEKSEATCCPKCAARMEKVAPIQGLSLLSERILRCPKCGYVTLSARPVE